MYKIIEKIKPYTAFIIFLIFGVLSIHFCNVSGRSSSLHWDEGWYLNLIQNGYNFSGNVF